MRMILAAILLVQAAPAQSEADKLEAALKKFGTRTYSVLLAGKNGATRTLKTTIVEEKGRKVAVFEVTDMEGGKQTETMIEKADLNGLKLISVKVTTPTDAKPREYTSTIEGLKATIRFPDQEPFTIDITEKTVGDEAVLRLVCAAEQKKGAELKLDLLSRGIPQVENGRVLKCEGKTQVDIGGKKVDAYLWTAKDPILEGSYKYWVSPEGYLLRWIDAGSQIEQVLETK